MESMLEKYVKLKVIFPPLVNNCNIIVVLLTRHFYRNFVSNTCLLKKHKTMEKSIFPKQTSIDTKAN